MLPVVLKRKLAPPIPERTVVTYLLTGNRRTGYGIKIVESHSKRSRIVNTAENVSRDRAEVLSLLRLFYEECLLAVHLHEVLDDYTRAGQHRGHSDSRMAYATADGQSG